jgi:NADH:ubiquinone oxidoreductase subunit 6 (subunit J)
MRVTLPTVLALLLVNDALLLLALGAFPDGVGTVLVITGAVLAPILALVARSQTREQRASVREEVASLRERVDDLEG